MALKEQVEMKDAIKRLAMSGALQSEKTGTDINLFVHTFAIRDLVYDNRIGRRCTCRNEKSTRQANEMVERR